MAIDGAAPAGDASAHERSFLGVDRSVSGLRWVGRLDRAGQQAAMAIAQSCDVPDLLARVAAARGVAPDEAAGWLDPSIRELMPDPSRLTGMDAAADRIATAVVRGERVAIFGDYDVDGATSAALLARYLRWNGVDPAIHIPDRVTEGYGPNTTAVAALAEDGATLLVTVDCGSTSHEALHDARARGLDVVVLDHHQLDTALPEAVALVNPNRQDDLSGLGHLAAVGVVFMALVAVDRVLRARGWYGASRAAPDLLGWLDLVALGTVADVVPLKGLNRAFVRKGLLVLRRRECPGLCALADCARLSGPVDTYHLGFLLGPRINAGGRIGDAGLGVRLLLCEDTTEAAEIAAALDGLNAERREIERATLEEALAGVEARGDADRQSVIVAHSESDWHPGIVGLVAARLKERYRRPAFAIAFSADGQGTGSGRSVAGVDLGAAVRAALRKGLLLKGGGHAMAAGLTVARDRLDDLVAFMDDLLGKPVADLAPAVLKLDGALAASGARVDTVQALEAAGPFGMGSPEPVFALPAHTLAFAEATAQGHVRCAFAAPDGGRLDAIAFRAADTELGAFLLSGRGRTMHAAGVLRIDRWGGRERVQFHLRDAAPTARP